MSKYNQLDEAVNVVAARILKDKSSRSKRTLMREIASRMVVREIRNFRELKAIIKLESQPVARNEPPKSDGEIGESSKNNGNQLVG